MNDLINEVVKIIAEGKVLRTGKDGNPKAVCSFSKHYTLEYVRKNFKNYAVKLSKDIICFDFDKREEFLKAFEVVQALNLHCIVIESVRGGGHIYFFNKMQKVKGDSQGNKTGLTLIVDIKNGIGKNGNEHNSAVMICDNSQERKVLYFNPTESGELGEVAIFFIPVKSSFEFINMSDGSGRNSSFYSYILALQSEGFTVEEARETIRIINQYILKEPLSEKELETILRDESFLKPNFFKGKTFLFDRFATYIKNNNHIIKIDGRLNIYIDNYYNSSLEKLEKVMIQHIPLLTDAKRKEVLKYLNIICDERQQADANMIAFKNGIYNIKDNSFISFSPEIIITNKINWDYNPAAYSGIADKTLNKIACNDNSIRSLLEELIGYCLYRRNELGKAFILTGDGANGKSTFIAVLNRILGDKNIAANDLKELSERFSTVTLYGKLANLGDDIGDTFITDPSLFKKIVTGDKIVAEQKGQPKFEFNPYCKMIFSANSVPRMNDKSNAIIRRLIIVPFEAKFNDTDDDFDPEIKYKLQSQESIEYFIKLGIEGLKRVLENKKFSISEKVKKELEEYEVSNNPILSFLKDCDDESFQIENEPTSRVYEHYCRFCDKNNFQSLSKTAFSKQLKLHASFETTTANDRGKTIRVYCLKNHS